ncbi:hypothetical protein JCM2421_20800 [Staphylococcus auricularis]|nr:hypothetical protein JCM2421_20800 [Staphylococcus auricularis]
MIAPINKIMKRIMSTTKVCPFPPDNKFSRIPDSFEGNLEHINSIVHKVTNNTTTTGYKRLFNFISISVLIKILYL